MIPVVARALDALRHGDPLGALRATEQASDPVVLALRGIALAQLAKRGRARTVVADAARALELRGDHLLAQRAWLAEAEIALSDYDVAHARRALVATAARLENLGDYTNCAWALLVAARAATLEGDSEGSDLLLESCRARTAGRVPAHVEATLAMAHAELAARKVLAPAALEFARAASEHAARSRNPTLIAEIEALRAALSAPAAKLESEEMLDLSALSSLLFSHVARVVVDGHGRRVWLCGTPVVDLTAHPVSFDILTCVGERAPDAVSVDAIARFAFGVRSPNASHEARLRTELLRLRALLPPKLGRLRQERGTVRWEPTLPVVVVRPLVARPEAHARALLADGRAWSVKSLSEAMSTSQRSVQRLLTALVARHLVGTLGSARSTRYALEAGTERIARRMLLLGLIADG